MFPPKGAPSGPPRNMRQVRRDVGVTQPDPVESSPRESRAVVSTTCPDCGAPIEQTFTAQAEEPLEAPVDAGQPLNTTGGGPVR